MRLTKIVSRIDRFGADWVVPATFVAFAVVFGHVAYDWLEVHSSLYTLIHRWFGPAGSVAMMVMAAWFAISHGRRRGRHLAKEMRLAEVAKFAGWQRAIFEEFDKVNGRIDRIAAYLADDVAPESISADEQPRWPAGFGDYSTDFDTAPQTVPIEIAPFPNNEPIPFQPDGYEPEPVLMEADEVGMTPIIEQDSDPINAWDVERATTVVRRRHTQPLMPLARGDRG